MSFPSRIRTIYRKELTDILRDQRTLVAMIVVPIVLYPLLMLGSVQAVSYQANSLEREKFIVATVGEEQAILLERLIHQDHAALEQEAKLAGETTVATAPESTSGIPPQSAPADEPFSLRDGVKVMYVDSREMLDQQIRDRVVHAGVVFAGESLVNAIDRQNTIEILADKEELRSTYLRNRLNDLFDRIAERMLAERKARAGLPPEFDRPIKVAYVDFSAPSSILGQVLPLVLILMTITGAIYPAIDLTAGERERGTLESLMVCPVPVIDLIVGKFLVVTTVAIMGAALNLASVSATVYFGGFDRIIAGSGGHIPYAKMVLILFCLIPFAVLMSAVMIAVCSYARTFKEAQNYVTPVILAVLIPGGIAAMPATRMEGVMLVMPVGNMVLLAREMLLGVMVPWWKTGMVLFSTTLYAAAAVALATRVFGRESVIFADAGSLRGALNRKLIRPSRQPSLTMSLLYTALLFPLWFFIQSALSPAVDEDARELLSATAQLMPLLFVLIPAAILVYWRVDLVNALGLRLPSFRHFAAAVVIGLTAWVLAHELIVLQNAFFPVPAELERAGKMIEEALKSIPTFYRFLFIAIIPAFCEEVLFRGFLMNGLRTGLRRWPAILLSAGLFGVFHFVFFRFPVTFLLGAVLGFLCWQARSIWPGVVAHFLHNGIGVMSVVNTHWYESLGIHQEQTHGHLPAHIIVLGIALLAAGLILASGREDQSEANMGTLAPGAVG